MDHLVKPLQDLIDKFRSLDGVGQKSAMRMAFSILDMQDVDAFAFAQAILDAKANNISGKDTTPFLLKAITDATNNKSLQANIALIYNNAKVGANIAKEYCKVK